VGSSSTFYSHVLKFEVIIFSFSRSTRLEAIDGPLATADVESFSFYVVSFVARANDCGVSRIVAFQG
jgi:hypothetical protein